MKKLVKNKILFIPPNGKIHIKDFSLNRIARFLSSMDNYHTVLIYISNIKMDDIKYFDEVIEVDNKDELIQKIETMKYDFIFHRSWMHAYSFAADLTQKYDNVIVNIKDWNFAPEDVYTSLFKTNKDFKAIAIIFEKAFKVLSHFTTEQIELWEKTYKINKKKFMFFPEYCNQERFVVKKNIVYDIPQLVFAGNISPTSYPEDYFPSKALLNSVRNLTKKNIKITFILPPILYDNSFGKNVDMYRDFDFERKFNSKFTIKRGEVLNPSILNMYHFGFFELKINCLNEDLFKYAVVSKFAFYLEASLPILVNEKFVSMATIVSENGLGIVFSNSDIENLDTVLKISQQQYSLYLKNIANFRNKYKYTDSIIESIFKC